MIPVVMITSLTHAHVTKLVELDPRLLCLLLLPLVRTPAIVRPERVGYGRCQTHAHLAVLVLGLDLDEAMRSVRVRRMRSSLWTACASLRGGLCRLWLDMDTGSAIQPRCKPFVSHLVSSCRSDVLLFSLHGVRDHRSCETDVVVEAGPKTRVLTKVPIRSGEYKVVADKYG